MDDISKIFESDIRDKKRTGEHLQSKLEKLALGLENDTHYPVVIQLNEKSI